MQIFRQPSYEEQFESHPPLFSNISLFMDIPGSPSRVPIQKKTIRKLKKIIPSPQQSQQSTEDQKKSKDYKKNICRNIMRHAVKGMLSSQNCKNKLDELFGKDTTMINKFRQYYNGQLEQITGFRVLKQHLMVLPQDSMEDKIRKMQFRSYLIWFLGDRASIYIILGEVNDPREYIRYKNEVLLYYVQRPEEWFSNSALWKTRSIKKDESQGFCQFKQDLNAQCT